MELPPVNGYKATCSQNVYVYANLFSIFAFSRNRWKLYPKFSRILWSCQICLPSVFFHSSASWKLKKNRPFGKQFLFQTVDTKYIIPRKKYLIKLWPKISIWKGNLAQLDQNFHLLFLDFILIWVIFKFLESCSEFLLIFFYFLPLRKNVLFKKNVTGFGW